LSGLIITNGGKVMTNFENDGTATAPNFTGFSIGTLKIENGGQLYDG